MGDGGVGGVEWCLVLCVGSDLKLFLLASGTLQASGVSTYVRVLTYRRDVCFQCVAH